MKKRIWYLSSEKFVLYHQLEFLQIKSKKHISNWDEYLLKKSAFKYTLAEWQRTITQKRTIRKIITLPYYLYKKNIIQDPSNRWQYYDASVENTDNIKEVDNYFEEHSEIIEEFVERDEEEEYDGESK